MSVKVGSWVRCRFGKRGKVIGIHDDKVLISKVVGSYPMSVQYTGERFITSIKSCVQICPPRLLHRGVFDVTY